MNREVKVTGMEVKTKVGANLLICSTNVEKDYKPDMLKQTRQALLEPVSTINGTDGSFYYTVDAAADGKKVHGTEGTDAAFKFEGYSETKSYANADAAKTKYDDKFNSIYTILSSGATPSGTGYGDGAPAYGYVDYTFYMKATGETDNQTINMTTCNLVYDFSSPSSGSILGSGTGTTGDQAWRVAVFAEELDATTEAGKGLQAGVVPSSVAANQKGLLKLATAGYFTNGKAVKEASNSTADAWLGAVVDNAATNGVIIGTLANAGDTKYFKVTVRLWLEGEDTTCTSETYAKLTDAYSLDLEFKLSGNTGSTAVKALSSNITTANDIETYTPAVEGDDYDGQPTTP